MTLKAREEWIEFIGTGQENDVGLHADRDGGSEVLSLDRLGVVGEELHSPHRRIATLKDGSAGPPAGDMDIEHYFCGAWVGMLAWQLDPESTRA